MKKILSLILCAALICASFCACSKSGGDEKSTASSQQSSIKYTYDSAYDSMDQSSVSAYKSLCGAVLNYTTDLRVNTGLLDDALQLFYTSFPLSALVEDIQNKSDKSGITIKYKYEEAEHKNKINSFNSKVNEIIRKCSQNSSNKAVFAVRVYNYIASSIKISDDEAVNCLDTVLNGSGSSFSYAQLFEYVLRQKDIKTYHVVGSDAIGKGWGIAGAVLYNNVYYFDPMSEHYDNGGEKLKFFGMTTQDLNDEGLKNLKLTNQEAAPDASDLKFDTLRKCDSWKLDGTTLLVSLRSEDTVEIAL